MTEPHSSKIFSFSEIVKGRNSSVRVTDDGLLYAVDLTMAMTGLARDQAGLVLRRLFNKFTKFTTISMIDRLFAGGGHPTKLITFEHAIELAMILPGETAKETRVAFANIIRRYLAGDKSLITEVEQNAYSSDSISQMARESINKENNPTKERTFRKRGLEQDDTLMQLIIQKTIIDTYTSLCENRVIDADAKLLFRENILKIAFQSVLVGWDNTTHSMNVCA